MLSNIEQAIANVFASEQEVILVNIMDAYVRVAGFTHWSADAFVAFEHALDKYPDSAEKADSLLAKLITELRQNYWHQMFGVPKGGDAQHSSCPCCGIMKLMQQTVDGQGHIEKAMQLAGQVPGPYFCSFYLLLLSNTLFCQQSNRRSQRRSARKIGV